MDKVQQQEEKMPRAEEKSSFQERKNPWKLKYKQHQQEFAKATQVWRSREQLQLKRLDEGQTPHICTNVEEIYCVSGPEPKFSHLNNQVTQIELGTPADCAKPGDAFYHCIFTAEKSPTLDDSSQIVEETPVVEEDDVQEPQETSEATEVISPEPEEPASEIEEANTELQDGSTSSKLTPVSVSLSQSEIQAEDANVLHLNFKPSSPAVSKDITPEEGAEDSANDLGVDRVKEVTLDCTAQTSQLQTAKSEDILETEEVNEVQKPHASEETAEVISPEAEEVSTLKSEDDETKDPDESTSFSTGANCETANVHQETDVDKSTLAQPDTQDVPPESGAEDLDNELEMSKDEDKDTLDGVEETLQNTFVVFEDDQKTSGVEMNEVQAPQETLSKVTTISLTETEEPESQAETEEANSELQDGSTSAKLTPVSLSEIQAGDANVLHFNSTTTNITNRKEKKEGEEVEDSPEVSQDVTPEEGARICTQCKNKIYFIVSFVFVVFVYSFKIWF